MKCQKAGVVKGKQRYKCKKCNKNQAKTDGRIKYFDEEKSRAFVLYLEGCGFRRIARIMSKFFGTIYRYQTIMYWLKSASSKVLNESKKVKNIYFVDRRVVYVY